MPDPGLDLPDPADQSSNHPFALARDRYVVVRKPSAQGSVVAKFVKANDSPRLPKSLHDYADFVVTYPTSKSALDAVTVDQAAADLTDEEKDILRHAGYPIL